MAQAQTRVLSPPLVLLLMLLLLLRLPLALPVPLQVVLIPLSLLLLLLLQLCLAAVVPLPPGLCLPLLPGRRRGREEGLAAAATGEGVRSAGQEEEGSGKLRRKTGGTPAQR